MMPLLHVWPKTCISAMERFSAAIQVTLEPRQETLSSGTLSSRSFPALSLSKELQENSRRRLLFPGIWRLPLKRTMDAVLGVAGKTQGKRCTLLQGSSAHWQSMPINQRRCPTRRRQHPAACVEKGARWPLHSSRTQSASTSFTAIFSSYFANTRSLQLQ